MSNYRCLLISQTEKEATTTLRRTWQHLFLNIGISLWDFKNVISSVSLNPKAG